MFYNRYISSQHNWSKNLSVSSKFTILLILSSRNMRPIKKNFQTSKTNSAKTYRHKTLSCSLQKGLFQTPDLKIQNSSPKTKIMFTQKEHSRSAQYHQFRFCRALLPINFPDGVSQASNCQRNRRKKENIQNNQIFKKKVKAKRKSVINKATKRKPLSVIETCSGRTRKGTFRGDKSKAGTVVEEAISHRKTLKGKSKTNIIKNSINKKIAEPKDSKFKKGLKQIKQDSNISGKLTNNVHTSTPKLMEAIKKIYKEKYLNTKGFKTSRPNDASYEYSTRSNKNLDLEHENAPAEENKVWEYPLKKPVVKKSENPKISRRKLSRSSCSKSKKDLGMDFLEIKPKKSAKPKKPNTKIKKNIKEHRIVNISVHKDKTRNEDCCSAYNYEVNENRTRTFEDYAKSKTKKSKAPVKKKIQKPNKTICKGIKTKRKFKEKSKLLKVKKGKLKLNKSCISKLCKAGSRTSRISDRSYNGPVQVNTSKNKRKRSGSISSNSNKDSKRTKSKSKGIKPASSMKMINVGNFEDGFEDEKPYEYVRFIIFRDNAQSSNYIKYKSFPSKFKRCREKSISELQFSLQQQIESIEGIEKSVQHSLKEKKIPLKKNLSKIKAKNSKNEGNRKLKRSKSSLSKSKVLSKNKTKARLGRHKRSKNGSKSSANLRSLSQKNESQGKRIEVAIPFQGIFMQDVSIESTPKLVNPQLTEQESIIIIQKWWRSVLSLRKANCISNLSKDHPPIKNLKRKKVKHSFSFGMDPNYTNITSNSNNSNAMFGCVTSKETPIFISQGFSEEYTNYKDKDGCKKTIISKGSESDLNPLLTEGTQEVRPEIDITSIEFNKEPQMRERSRPMAIEKPAVEEIFILNPTKQNSGHAPAKIDQSIKKREKSFDRNNNFSSSKVEISSEFQDSPLLKSKPEDKIESRLENIHDLAPMTLSRTMKRKLCKKRSKSLKEATPQMKGLLHEVMKDMVLELIDIEDFTSLRLNKSKNDIIPSPRIEANLLSSCSSEDMDNIVVNKLILDDSEDSMVHDQELKIEDLIQDLKDEHSNSPSECNYDLNFKGDSFMNLVESKNMSDSSGPSALFKNSFPDLNQPMIRDFLCKASFSNTELISQLPKINEELDRQYNTEGRKQSGDKSDRYNEKWCEAPKSSIENSEKSEKETCSNAMKAISEAKLTTERIKNLLNRSQNQLKNKDFEAISNYDSESSQSRISQLKEKIAREMSNSPLKPNLSIPGRIQNSPLKNQRNSDIEVKIITDLLIKNLISDCIKIPQRKSENEEIQPVIECALNLDLLEDEIPDQNVIVGPVGRRIIPDDLLERNCINIFQDFESIETQDLQKYDINSMMNPSTLEFDPYLLFEKSRSRKQKKELDQYLLEDFLDEVFNKICVRKDLFLIAFSQPTQNDPLICLEEIQNQARSKKVRDPRDYTLTDNLFKAACQAFIPSQDQCSICNTSMPIALLYGTQKDLCICNCNFQMNHDEFLDTTGYKEKISETSLKVSIYESSKLIHYKAIFDGINEAINSIRPMQNFKAHLPWSSMKVLPEYDITEVQRIYSKVKEILTSWSSSNAGPLPCSDCYTENDFNEELFTEMREQNLNLMLSEEVSNEASYKFYDIEETEVKIQLSKDIFDFLLSETVELLNLLE
ncbi:unnamed protein product [Moneuplotes crassus]|uniref:DUF4378 domain-containing protein n=1 Tax=Euplotes crassus TaxID=5936 RepID=A0AAD1Y5U0_EUPCR|nr:unnamed protein product [Moneuplotes crassus]